MLTRQSRRDRVPRFELIPMIDVMMILTIFLAVMAFLPQVRTSLEAQLPQASSATDTPPSVTIELTRNGISLDEDVARLEERALEIRKAIFENLTPQQRIQIARHARRPPCSR